MHSFNAPNVAPDRLTVSLIAVPSAYFMVTLWPR